MAKFDSEWIPKSAMTIFAHPDDTEFSCSGTIAKWAGEGCEITYVLCTSGDVGTHDLKYSPESLTVLREQEQRNACALLGVQQVEFLRHEDSRLVADLTLRRELVYLIRKYQPQVVFCGDPNQVFWGNRINHPDHRAAALAAIDAIFPCASMELLWPEEGPAHEVHGVYVRDLTLVDTWIDITGTMDLKIKALAEHHSQLDGIRGLEAMIRQRSADTGKKHGLKYAEAFRVIKLKGD
ncbi:MAG: PIG-L family deacetylase [Deltaproteobacteria bacterium]|nr:PIG-L family deacetylase [Deltaproteobacteria bacterium]